MTKIEKTLRDLNNLYRPAWGKASVGSASKSH